MVQGNERRRSDVVLAGGGTPVRAGADEHRCSAAAKKQRCCHRTRTGREEGETQFTHATSLNLAGDLCNAQHS